MDRFEYLLDGFVAGSLTEAELQEFTAVMESNLPLLETRIDADLQNNAFAGLTSQQQMKRMLANIKQRTTTTKKPGIVRTIKPWIKWTAAAAIIIIIATVAVFSLRTKDQTKPSVANITHDVPAPKDSRAVIVLADGTKVYLDSVGNGTIAQQNNVSVVKNANGEILYLSPAGGGGLNDSPNNKRPGVDFNTLTNPRGSKVITMTLSDGSHVWLNAGSSVTYPVAFVGNERKVSITGEAYFEVKHDATKPFIVNKGETSVTVLGTHFNVNAYDDEDALKVTLLEGSVNVKRQSSIVKLVPGQQAVVTSDVKLSKEVDVDEVMAWKNGRFELNGNVQGIMREVSRWYDVDIVYEGDFANKRFGGTLSREENVSKVLKYLELTGSIHFKVEGRKITVMP